MGPAVHELPALGTTRSIAISASLTPSYPWFAMNPPSHRPFGAAPSHAWAARALLAVVAIIGVLAMHALTMNHDPAMSGMDSTSAQAMAPMGATTAADQSSMHAAHTPVFQGGWVLASAVHDEGGMASVCLAYLTALVLLIGAARQMVTSGRADEAFVGRGLVAWATAARTRASPDLAELCVLRT